MGVSLPRLSVVHVRRRRSVLAVLAGVAIVLELAAGTGLAYVAGGSQVRAVLGNFDGIWLIALAGALLVSFVGYYYAYRGIFRVEGGPGLPRRQMRAVVAAGFGGFLAHGGGALDQYALQAAGRRRVRPRHAWPPWAAWSTASWRSAAAPPRSPCWYPGAATAADFTIPWAVIPIPGFLVGFWAADRYHDRFRGRAGLAGEARYLPGLDPHHPGAVRPPAALGVCAVRHGAVLGGGRAGHLGGAGHVRRSDERGRAVRRLRHRDGVHPPDRAAGRRGRAGSGAAADHLGHGRAVRGSCGRLFVYRVLALLLPMPVSLAALPTLRTMAQHPASQLSGAGEVNEPALQPTPGTPGMKDSS